MSNPYWVAESDKESTFRADGNFRETMRRRIYRTADGRKFGILAKVPADVPDKCALAALVEADLDRTLADFCKQNNLDLATVRLET